MLPVRMRRVSRENADVRRAALRQTSDTLWDRGRLRHLCRPGGQLELYDRFHEQPKRFEGTAEPLFGLCHRRFGKSYAGAIFMVERCLSEPGSDNHFGSDTKEHAREIFDDKFHSVMDDAPHWITYRTRRNKYFLRNRKWPPGVESVITLQGIDYSLGGAMRGTGKGADLVVLDEVRECRHLEYVMKRVITPMFRGRKRPQLLMITTPPDSMDHDSVRVYIRRARDSDSLVTIPASRNPDWTPDDERLMLQEYGSKDDIGWRRELECELIPDSSMLIVPEWAAARPHCVVPPVPRPEHYAPWVVVDCGWKDHTGAILAWYDFRNRRIVVVDEVFVNYVPTEDFAALLAEKIRLHFSGRVSESLRILGEGNELNLADLNRALSKLGDYFVSEVDKYDKHAAINNLRSGVQAGRVVIEGALDEEGGYEGLCGELDYQLLNGTWNKRRTDFDRTSSLGHCDVAVCLNYLYKSMLWDENPVTPEKFVWSENKAINPYNEDNWLGSGQDEETVGSVEKIFGKRRRFL